MPRKPHFWRVTWQQDRRNVSGHVKVCRRVPPGAVHQQDGLGAGSDVTGYLIEMELHRFGIGLWQHERGANSKPWPRESLNASFALSRQTWMHGESCYRRCLTRRSETG